MKYKLPTRWHTTNIVNLNIWFKQNNYGTLLLKSSWQKRLIRCDLEDGAHNKQLKSNQTNISNWNKHSQEKVPTKTKLTQTYNSKVLSHTLIRNLVHAKETNQIITSWEHFDNYKMQTKKWTQGRRNILSFEVL